MTYLLKYTRGLPTDPEQSTVIADASSPGEVIQQAWQLFGTDIYIKSIEEV